MGTAAERRSNDAIRVPLEALIELSHDDFGDHFEAECVNLSARGVSMRAAYLPEPGTHVSCRFQNPPTGEKIHARGEVVWAQDSGQRMGEFGIRFVGLDNNSERMIHDIVSEVLARETEPASEELYTSARLSLDGVASPIVARVMHAAKDLVTVTQELSFLKLGRGVSMRVGDEMETRRGKIDGIDLSFTGDVPSLVLQVVYDEMPSAEQSATARVEETTLTDFDAPKMDDIVGHAMPVLETATMTTATVTTATVTTTTTNVTKERDGVRVIRTEGEFDRERLASINAFFDSAV
ncbi:MAG: PilZ domain-containing protein [Sandaracinaceae bacterium]|nr:PilZ domain-containing protein [Sandaracinaceae bacterium]